MRRGFIVPLVVAFTFALSQAFAVAPVISCVPDVIISDAEQNTLTGDRNFFIYSNALDLDELVKDDDTSKTGLKWCYIESSPRNSIQINRLGSYTGTNFRDPGAFNIRAVSRYATFRNVKWSPTTGTMPFANPGVASMDSMLQLYVSDGTKVDSQTLKVTSVNTTGSAGRKDGLVMQSLKSYTFATGSDGWTWYEITGAPGISAPSAHAATGGNLSITETSAQSPTVFGSWESLRDPAVALHSRYGCVMRARYQCRSSAAGDQIPGWRLRMLWTRVMQSGGLWNVDFLNPDTNDNWEEMNTQLYLPAANVGVLGREPGTAGRTYAALFYPHQIESLQSSVAVVYISFDIVDLDSLADANGTLYVDQVDVDGIDRPETNSPTATAVPGLSFTSFSGWQTNIANLGTGFNAPTITAGASSIDITVAAANKMFEASAVSPNAAAVALVSGNYYRAIFTVTSSQASGNFGPIIRSGVVSTRLTYSVNKELKGGGTWSQVGTTPTEFEMWWQAPSPWPQAGTTCEPMQLRFESYLTDNPSLPFNRTVAGTLRCTRVVTQSFLAP